MKLTIRNVIEIVILSIIIIFAFAIKTTEPLFIILLLIWTFCMLYAARDIRNRAMLFAFLISFFIFLLGRDVVKQFLNYETEIFDKNAQNHAWMSFSVSLITLIFFYNLFEKRVTTENHNKLTATSEIYRLSVRQNSLLFYYISFLFAIISKIAISIYVSNSSFTDYYTGYSDYLRENTILYIMSKLEIMMPISWAVYLGTFPSKKEVRFPLFLYLVYMVVSLGTGQRSTAMLGLLFLTVYFLFRDRGFETWVTKKMVVLAIVSLPFLALFISFYELSRQGSSTGSLSLVNGIVKFFYDQGVTSTIVKRAYTFKSFIPKQIYTLEFAHSGILARLFDIPVYHGNNVEHALYGGSFTHSLSYIIMRPSYLAGRGTGSCYIAELYQDFSYPGIILGNAIYGYIIYKISDLRENNYISNGYKLFIIPFILWTPRGSFTHFISQTLSPITIATFILIYTLSLAMAFKYIRNLDKV